MAGNQKVEELTEKKVVLWARIAALVAGTIALVSVAYAVCTWARLITPSRTIMVSAEGITAVKPDIAIVSFSVISEGTNITSLQADNTEKMNAATALVKGIGIADEDIKTSSYNLSPRYRYDPKTGRSSIDGYQITQTVTIKVRDLEKAGSIVAGLPGVGINQIQGPDFQVEDIDKYLADARTEAFGKARAKAQVLARSAGVKLGRVVTFSENAGGYPITMFAKAEGMGGDGGVPVPDFQEGTEEARVNVSVTFEIR